MAALVLIDQHVRAGSQFLIATHSPILLALPGTRILQVDDDAHFGEWTMMNVELSRQCEVFSRPPNVRFDTYLSRNSPTSTFSGRPDGLL